MTSELDKILKSWRARKERRMNEADKWINSGMDSKAKLLVEISDDLEKQVRALHEDKGITIETLLRVIKETGFTDTPLTTLFAAWLTGEDLIEKNPRQFTPARFAEGPTVDEVDARPNAPQGGLQRVEKKAVPVDPERAKSIPRPATRETLERAPGLDSKKWLEQQ